MTRANICKLKVASGFFRVALTAPAPLPPAEREELFVEAIKMIEYDTMIQARDSLKGFLWYTNMHFPFPAYICLLTELRHRTTGELCERAWETICEHADRRKMTSHMRSPMHLSFSPLFVKAWDAREAAEAALGRTLAPPRLITHMRQIAARLPKTIKKRSPVPTPSPKIPVISGSYVATAPTPPEQSNMPGAVPLYPQGSDLFGGGSMPQMDMNRQFANVFPELNIGGEMDWNYLMQEYAGFVAHPPQMTAYANQTPMQDPNQPQAATWQ
ncbi:hypothetical protein PC116_g28800 [Phytophthora cactorum]|nr:hypothetical protein PC116_g28800 [Phytophthora cactorum]